MSSILTALGGSSEYAPLSALPPDDLAQSQNIVLLILDGFGYEFLCRQEKNTVLHKFLVGPLTTVFPSTTATGISTFLTGLAPEQHAVTGWFMFLKEVGSVTTSLRFQPRCCRASLSRDGFGVDAVYGNGQEAFQRVNRSTYSLHHTHLKKAEYNLAMNPCARPMSFKNEADCFRKLKKLITRRGKEQRYIFAYWEQFDSLCHKHGTRSAEVQTHYAHLVTRLTKLVDAIHKTDTTLIITADHGLIDTEPTKIIELKHHPALQETLILPLCGEPRVAYCYVRPAKTAQFERYVTQHFYNACDLYRSEDLIAQHYFGLFTPDPRLYDRIGDYVLIMRENYIIKDFLMGEEEKFQIGNHGGVSSQEMLVPLIVIRT